MSSKATRKLRRGDVGQGRTAGFTLMELVVAILVFALGIMGILKMHQASVQTNNFSMQLTEAVNAAEDEMEFLRGLSFNHNSMSLGNHNTTTTLSRNIPYNVSYRIETTPETGGNGRTVTIFVTWQEKNLNHMFTLPLVMDELD
jgi:type IV pilus assembly protein PilV